MSLETGFTASSMAATKQAMKGFLNMGSFIMHNKSVNRTAKKLRFLPSCYIQRYAYEVYR